MSKRFNPIFDGYFYKNNDYTNLISLFDLYHCLENPDTSEEKYSIFDIPFTPISHDLVNYSIPFSEKDFTKIFNMNIFSFITNYSINWNEFPEKVKEKIYDFEAKKIIDIATKENIPLIFYAVDPPKEVKSNHNVDVDISDRWKSKKSELRSLPDIEHKSKDDLRIKTYMKEYTNEEILTYNRKIVFIKLIIKFIYDNKLFPHYFFEIEPTDIRYANPLEKTLLRYSKYPSDSEKEFVTDWFNGKKCSYGPWFHSDKQAGEIDKTLREAIWGDIDEILKKYDCEAPTTTTTSTSNTTTTAEPTTTEPNIITEHLIISEPEVTKTSFIYSFFPWIPKANNKDETNELTNMDHQEKEQEIKQDIEKEKEIEQDIEKSDKIDLLLTISKQITGLYKNIKMVTETYQDIDKKYYMRELNKLESLQKNGIEKTIWNLYDLKKIKIEKTIKDFDSVKCINIL